MKQAIYNTYQSRLEKFSDQAKSIKSKFNLLSWFRVMLFVGATIAIVIFFDSKNGAAAGVTFGIAVTIYLALLKTHSNLRFNLKLTQAKEKININEIKRLNNDLNDFPDGKNYYDVNHPYHEDLDIFGRHSLFQLVNRTSTFIGEKVLTSWLSKRSETEEILERQEGVQELASDIDLRQDFHAHGIAATDTVVDHQPLLTWLEEDMSTKGISVYKILLWTMPLAMLTTIVLSSMGYIQSGIPVLIGIVNISILGGLFKRIVQISRRTEMGYKSLKSMQYHIDMLENRSFTSKKLNTLKSTVVREGVQASKIIKELQLILDNFQNRANLMYVIFDLLFLLDVYWYLRIVNWKQKNRSDISGWFHTVGELDALVSIAGFTYSNPGFCFPNISDRHFEIRAEKLGHPLISDENRVTNNLEFSGQGGICLITGSNMSGKSTFLRTVGINCVLGLMGAPVCAEKMTISQLQIFTSMRSQDDLEENVSSFYAELKRLKQLLSTIDNQTPLLFMIDEVLKGTNSEDRHKGALALIKQLNAAYTFGFVSTHDIALGNITNELTGVKNYSFNSEIIGDEIKFDYTLTPGICKSFNATKLMQKMGIDIPEEASKVH